MSNLRIESGPNIPGWPAFMVCDGEEEIAIFHRREDAELFVSAKQRQALVNEIGFPLLDDMAPEFVSSILEENGFIDPDAELAQARERIAGCVAVMASGFGKAATVCWRCSGTGRSWEWVSERKTMDDVNCPNCAGGKWPTN